MALSGFGRGKDDGSNTTQSHERPAPSAPSGGANLTAFIDQGSEFEGKLSFKDTVRIDGRFRGEITSENTLIVGESGEIEAKISSTNVVISGTVLGDIEAGRQVVLHKSARVEGNIQAPSIIVEEGAVFNGSVAMDRRSDRAAKPSASLTAIKGGSKEKEANSGS